jgi:hypothetical protein
LNDFKINAYPLLMLIMLVIIVLCALAINV